MEKRWNKISSGSPLSRSKISLSNLMQPTLPHLPKSKKAYLMVLAGTLLFGNLVFSKMEAAPDNPSHLQKGTKVAAKAEESGASSAVATHKYNAKSLHRLDFRVVGKSCAVCLSRMQGKTKGLPGVVKAAIMLKKPYGAVVVYDSTQLNVEKILSTTKEGVPEVEFEDITDEAIKEVPVVLIPKTAVPAE